MDHIYDVHLAQSTYIPLGAFAIFEDEVATARGHDCGPCQ